MKSNTALRVVENNSFATKGFTIQASGKMFHMVISGLYSNKPQSITREIWSNAFDAHAMVGKQDVPFEVTFPTDLNPIFSCRDFGPGLAHEDMEGFYTVLGHSTKEETNDAVGKWGVGRMSPMSYTDTFSVVSRHKGMIAHYTVVIGVDGSPELNTLAPPTPTTEPDGLCISFPVKRSDISAFQKAAEVVSYGFDVPPIITNTADKKLAPLTKVYEGKGYYFYEDTRMSGTFAKMGCVLYPIPSEYLAASSNPYRKAVYEFEIGELEVTASREALSFGPKDPTADSIRNRVAKVEAQIFNDLQAEIEAKPTEVRAARAANAFRQYLPKANFTWRGKEVRRYWKLDLFPDLDIHVGTKRYGQRSVGWGTDTTMDTSQKYKVYIQDTSDKKGCARASRRIGEHMGHYSSGCFVWVRVDLKKPQAKAALDALLDYIGAEDVYQVKGLHDSGVRAPTSRAKVSVSTFAGHLSKYEMDDAEFNAGGYLYLMSNNYVDPVVERGYRLIQSVHNKVVVCVPKTLWKKFEGQTQWKSAVEEITRIKKKEEPIVEKLTNNNYSVYPYNRLIDFSDVGGPVGSFADNIKMCANRPKEHLGMSLSWWESTLGKTSDNSRVISDYNNLLKTYPMLQMLLDYGHRVDKKHWAEYFQLVNNAAKGVA